MDVDYTEDWQDYAIKSAENFVPVPNYCSDLNLLTGVLKGFNTDKRERFIVYLENKIRYYADKHYGGVYIVDYMTAEPRLIAEAIYVALKEAEEEMKWVERKFDE